MYSTASGLVHIQHCDILNMKWVTFLQCGPHKMFDPGYCSQYKCVQKESHWIYLVKTKWFLYITTVEYVVHWCIYYYFPSLP